MKRSLEAAAAGGSKKPRVRVRAAGPHGPALPQLSEAVRLEAMQREVTLGALRPEPMPGLQAVPATFSSRVAYAGVFAPLMLEEAREVLRQEAATARGLSVTVTDAGAATEGWITLRLVVQDRDARHMADAAVLRSLGGAGPALQVAGAAAQRQYISGPSSWSYM